MKHFHFILFAFIVLYLPIHAQPSQKKPVKQCNAMLARQTVEQQADFSKTLGETDQRVNVLIKIADFLWTSDEPSARGYFTEAFKVAQERFREKGNEPLVQGKMILRRVDYRFEVVRAIAKYDGEWAKKLSEMILKEFDEDKEKDKRDSYDRDREVRELLGLSAKVAKDNPALALSLARRVMRYQLSNDWYFALYQMAGNNQSLADQIYGEALDNYSNAEVFRLLYLSAYPFGRQRIFGIESSTLGSSVPSNYSSNPNLQRQFLLTLLRRVSKLTPESTEKSLQTQTPESAVAVIAMNELEPVVSQQFPDLMPAFSQAKIHAGSVVSNEMMEAANKRDESGKSFGKPFAEKLKDLEKADAEGKLKDSQIVNLLTSAKKEEDYKAAETWLDKITEEAPRESAKNYFYFQRSKLAAKENRFEEAQKYADKIGKIELRAVVYFEIAEAKQKNPSTRLESLDSLSEIYKMAQKSPDTIEKAQVLLGLAYMYEKVDHFTALDALSASIKTANKLENPNLFTSFMTQQIVLKDFASYIGYEVPGFDINRTFYEISRKDFQGAISQAESFSDKYLRTLAVLASVKDCEKNEPPVKPGAKNK
jgi:tetratricopeptide (TPR) repeat protein